MTFFAVLFPKSLNILRAWVLTASSDLSRGVFLSSASPVYEQNAVGMQSMVPVASSFKNAGEVMSHAV